jgi:DNA recombination protein RmuC
VTLLAIVCLLGLVGALGLAAWQWREAEYWRREAQQFEVSAAQQQASAAAERKATEEKIELLHRTQQKAEQTFRALASEALQANSQAFLDRSREQMRGIVSPVQETLQRFDQSVQQLETARAEAYGTLTAQIQNLMQSESQLRSAADQLKNALRTPHQRGRWGELQLRRAIEMAGMLAHCDFEEQVSIEGARLRPDVVIRLPNQRNIAVDAKVSLDAYLKAIECEDENERERLLANHARQVRVHVKALGDKSYWDRLEGSPEFVVAFLPLESLYSAALQRDPDLLTFGVERRVLLATPTTLIAVLFSVAHGWRERDFTENARRIRDLGRELSERILLVHKNMAYLGGELQGAVEAYNSAVWSIENRVLVTARKFREMQGGAGTEMNELVAIDTAPRVLSMQNWADQ